MTKPIRQGQLNGVNWRSLTTKKEMRANLAEGVLIRYKRFKIDLTLPEAINKLGFKSSDDFVNAQVENYEVLIYYKSKSRYNNNYRVK